ncbi:hypothetical protein GS399_04460 [Pedobacter sp. HMF7647]|uniref:Uncharacterized protein n=1 Tax=Hufsiella arboris TaxID=2695275 RepID=A0A7K1Y6L7_9SPHI|nr:hypothetical protein [Hufsiella arboris]MXV50213.1 hypothetical protein [Hufsiella arboris]
MKTSSLEITEHEYLIKLRKDDFDLGFINQLLKRIQTEQSFFSFKSLNTEDDLIAKISESDNFSRFDHLNDK